MLRRAIFPSTISLFLGLSLTLTAAIIPSVAIESHYHIVRRGAVHDPKTDHWFALLVADVAPGIVETSWSPLTLLTINGASISATELRDPEYRLQDFPIIAPPHEPLPLTPTTERIRTAFGSPFPCLSRAWDRDLAVPGPALTRDSKPAHLGTIAFDLPTRIHPLPFAADTLIIAALLAAFWYACAYALKQIRIMSRTRSHQCPACAYTRQGLDPSSPCPECGHT